jgi:transcriptional regulator with XRE-family HTH domain
MEETFGRKLQRWRESANITQAELARRVEVSPTYISNLERDFSPTAKGGKPQPSVETCDKIARALGVKVAEVRLAAGYAPQGAHADTIEEALEMASYFEHKGLSEANKEELRPLLQVADREVERLVSRPHPASQLRSSTPKVTQSSARKRDKIDELIDSALRFGGRPISDADRKIIREILEKQDKESKESP